MDKAKLYQRALQHYGYENLCAQLATAGSDLASATMGNMFNDRGERQVAEAIADIEIMIEQFRLNGLANFIDHIKQEKLVQLAQRVGFGGDSDGLL